MTCDKYAECRAFGPYDARCVCVTNCPSIEQNLCASHGKSYNNLCFYKLDVCQTRSNYTYYHHGSCRGGLYFPYFTTFRHETLQFFYFKDAFFLTVVKIFVFPALFDLQPVMQIAHCLQRKNYLPFSSDKKYRQEQ